MNQRIITIWGSWTNTTPVSIWNIYPASQKALEKAKAFVGTMERNGMQVEVSYDELEEERGMVNIDLIYKTTTGKVWKEIKL